MNRTHLQSMRHEHEQTSTFRVTISRTTVEERTYTIEALTQEEACNLAHEQAADEVWAGSADVQYATESVSRIPAPLTSDVLTDTLKALTYQMVAPQALPTNNAGNQARGRNSQRP